MSGPGVWERRAPARADEAGFTVVETVVASGLLMVVLSTLLGVLNMQTAAERRVRASVDNQEDIRFALLAMARDIRAADPLLPLTSAAAYGSSLELQLKDVDGTHIEYVRWIYDPATATLSRQVLAAPQGSPTATTFVLTRVRNAEKGVTMFRYFNSWNAELTTTSATVSDVANCTIRVHMTVYADSSPGPEPFSSESDAELRNRLPGGVGC